jgi:cytochrome d ubiquinol oxidase subunit I
MDDALLIHRLHFSFTVTYHYLFPQLTMGLALLIVVLKSLSLWAGDSQKCETYDQAARFWAKIFGVNFVFGVVTGIPMEFQFGTNWARFSTFAGGVIGQTLAMEGMFAFFLESSFLGLFLYGEKRLSRRAHWFVALMVFVGSWLSGFFIIATNAWMQHPVGYTTAADGSLHVNDFWALVFNPWVFWQYVHNMGGAVVTGSFAMAALGAYYTLTRKDVAFGKVFLRVAVIVALIASVWMAFPSGDGQGRNIARYQPATLAAMEGLYKTEGNAPLVIVGQPDTARGTLDNPVAVPGALGFLTYKRWGAEVKGLDAFPRDQWPDNVPLLYYSYHIMVGLGTILIAVAGLAAFQLRRDRLYQSRWLLWVLMLSFPFPFIANTAGWMTAELGRQPWLVFGLLRTARGASTQVSAGNGLFTLLGFMGMYTALSILYLFLMWREIDHGPGRPDVHIPSGRREEYEPRPEREAALTVGD